MMRGVILAAGRGGRLRGITGDLPKCLARLGSMTLIERQIGELRRGGVTAVTVVVGYRAQAVRRVCDLSIECLDNVRFEVTNSLYSLWCARHRLSDGFVVLNADVLFHPQLLIDLLTARYDDALLVEAPNGDRPYTEEEMKVRVRRGQIVDISKSLDPDESDGENIGIAKFGSAGAEVLVQEMTRLLAAGSTRDWLPAAFQAFSRLRPLHAIESRGFPWIEIDSPEDYWRACSEVLPEIDGLAAVNTRGRAASVTGQAGMTPNIGTTGRSSHHV